MHVTLIGATGLTGGHLLQLLLEDDQVKTVRILIRRPSPLTHAKMEKVLVDFTDQESFRLALENCEILMCAIGTTQKKVNGDIAAYRKVDYDIAVHAARYGKLGGCRKFVLVSAVGADSKSRNFYLRLKGEIEEAVQASGIEKVYIMRPSLLLGNRKESRPLEKIAGWLMRPVSFILPAKYRPVKAADLARTMLYAVKQDG